MVREEIFSLEKLIDIEKIVKVYGESVILNHLSLEVETGEVVAIIGASGSGKSTLVRCLAGLEPIQSGMIKIADQEIKSVQEASGLVGMVFQNFNLFPHFTVLDNVRKPYQTIHKKGIEEATLKAKQALAAVHLDKLVDQYPATLSGGQQQRLAIARSMVMTPKIMIFDEPTSSLDPQLAHEVFTTIRNLAKLGQTMLIVTHQIKAVKHFATRIVYLNNGMVEEDGPPEYIFAACANANLQRFLKMVEFDDLEDASV